MKQICILIFLNLIFISIDAQIDFNRSLFDSKQLETIDKIDSISYKRSGIKIGIKNAEKIDAPSFCPYILDEIRQLDILSFNQKMELIHHKNPVLNAYGFWLIAEIIDSHKIKDIINDLINKQIKFINTSCADVVSTQTLSEFCIELLDKENKYWGTECIKLSKSEINELIIKADKQINCLRGLDK